MIVLDQQRRARPESNLDPNDRLRWSQLVIGMQPELVEHALFVAPLHACDERRPHPMPFSDASCRPCCKTTAGRCRDMAQLLEGRLFDRGVTVPFADPEGLSRACREVQRELSAGLNDGYRSYPNKWRTTHRRTG